MCIRDSYKIGDVSCIEKVQRSFTKRLPGLNNSTYRERLVVTNLDSLEVRRLRVDLIMCYKIVFRLINVDFCAFFFVLQSLAILVAMVINCLPSSLPTKSSPWVASRSGLPQSL